MLKVIQLTAHEDFTLDVQFNTHEWKRFDAKPYLSLGIFQELQDPQYFLQARLAFDTVQWPHEQDFSPDTLYLEGQALAAPETLIANVSAT